MPKAATPEQIQTIQNCLKLGGLSQRDIAERVGVSRSLVQMVADGRRSLEVKKRGPKPLIAEFGEEVSPTRCVECGEMVTRIQSGECLECFGERTKRLKRLFAHA